MDTEYMIINAYINLYIKYWWIILLIIAISRWFIFKKANKFQLAAFVPLYGDLIEFQMIGFSPIFSIIFVIFMPVLIYLCIYNFTLDYYIFSLFQILTCFIVFGSYLTIRPMRLAALFGKSNHFGFGLSLCPIVFYPILAFDKSTYIGI